MDPPRLYRLAGLAGVLGGLCLIAQYGSLLVNRTGDLVLGLVLLAGWILALYAITGVYLVQRSESGTLGAIGYAVNILGLALVIGRTFAANLVFRRLPEETVQSILIGGLAPVIFGVNVVLWIGALLLAIATVRAGVLPRWAAVLYAVGLIGEPAQLLLRGLPVVPVGGILAGIGLIWLGLGVRSLATRQEAAAAS